LVPQRNLRLRLLSVLGAVRAERRIDFF